MSTNVSARTISKFETLMNSMDEFQRQLVAEQQFEESEMIEEAIMFLGLLRNTDLLHADAIEDDGPVTGDMNTLRELCAEMKALQIRAAELKAQAADVKAPFDYLRLKKIPDLMASLQVGTCTFPGLGRVQLASDLFASTRKGQKPAAIQWLNDCGYGDMVQPTYNASSLKALFRRMIVEGAEIPNEIFNVNPFIRASIVKA